MKNIFLLAVTFALAGQALADVNYDLATKQARRAADQNNAEQNRIGREAGGGQSQSPSSPSAPPMDPVLAATLQNIADLKADLDALSQAADATAGAAQRVSLLNHLSSAAATGKKATTASIKKLADQLIATMSGRKNLAAQNTKLARSLHALFNGAHLSATQQETLLAGVKKVLTEAGVPAEDTDHLVASLKQVVTETQ
jgi:uncharacterized phage infection (PIP) family protein YhgE